MDTTSPASMPSAIRPEGQLAAALAQLRVGDRLLALRRGEAQGDVLAALLR